MAKRSLPFVVRRQRKDGTFAYRGFADDADGKRVFSVTCETEQAAYDAALGMRGEAKNRTGAETLFEANEQLLDEVRTKRTKGTVRWYADHGRALCRMFDGDTLLHAITRERIEEAVRDRLRKVDGQRSVKPQTVNADLRALHRVFAFAIRRGIVRENPVRQVDRPRADAPAMDWFTDQELIGVLAKLGEFACDRILLFASTGIRRSEAERLQPAHVRLNLRQLVVPGKNRTVLPLAPTLDEPLRRILASASDDALLPGGVHAIDELFREARKIVGDRRLHAHAMRHTFCTTLVRQGVRLDVVMRLADHRDIKTTMRYSHEVGADGEHAVRLLRFVPPSESGPAAQA